MNLNSIKLAINYLIIGLLTFSVNTHANSRLNELLKQTQAPISKHCQKKLNRVFVNIAKKNQYRLLDHSLAKSNSLQLFVLLMYNDQSTHLSINVHTKSCQINTQESFQIIVPCPEIRESLFKRFNIIGSLSKKTMVLRLDSPKRKEQLIHPKQARPIAFLTQNLNGKGCFVSKKQNNVQTKSSN